MKTYQNVRPQYVAPIDLQTLNTAYANLESMHQQAVQTSSELKNAIAQLQLNESEEPFRQQLVKSVEDTISQNMYHDNLAGAYDDIVKLSGDIVSNPALIGRLKAQQEYLKYKAQIESSDIPEQYKENFKKLNPYYYQDFYDESGKITGGSKWEPNRLPVKKVDYNALMTKALQYITPSQNSTEVARFMKEDGTFTTKLEPGVKAVWYDAVTTQTTEITQDEINKALDAAIKADPGALASLRQDFEMAKMDHDKGVAPIHKVFNGTRTYTFNEFVDNIFSSMPQAKAQKNVSTSRELNKNFYKDYAAAFASNDVYEETGAYSGDSIIGPLVEFTDYSTVQTINSVKRGNEEFNKRYTELTGIENPQISIKDKDSYYSAISKLSIFRDIPKEVILDRNDLITYINDNNVAKGNQIINMYDKLIKEFEDYQVLYAEDIYNENKILELDDNDKSLAASYFKADMLNGDTWDETSENYREPINNYENRLRDGWRHIVNTYYPTDAIALNVEFMQHKGYDNFVNAIGKENLVKYGIDVKHDGKRTIVSLPKENVKYLEHFAKAVGKSEDSLTMFQRQGHIYYTTEDGKKRDIRIGGANEMRPALPNDFVRTVVGYIDSVEETSNQHIGQSKYIETFILPGGTTSSTEAQYAIKALDVANPDDMKRLSSLKSAAEVNNDYILDNIRLSGETNCKIRILDKDKNIIRTATGKEAIDYKNMLFNSNNVGEPGIIFLPDEMKYVPYITFSDADGTLRYMTYDFGNNHRITRDLNNDINLKSRAELMLSHGQQKSIKVGGIGDSGSYSPILLTPTSDGGFNIGNVDGKYDSNSYSDFHIYPNDSSFGVAVELKTFTEELNYIKLHNIQLTDEGKRKLLNNYIILVADLMKYPYDALSNNMKIELIKGFSAESGIQFNINE